jgi:tryptophan-rich sensory protein
MDREPLINLVAMLLQIAATLLCTAVFWNKDRMCGLWMIPSLIWSIFLGIITMALSILNP